jgi:hypothetical protein
MLGIVGLLPREKPYFFRMGATEATKTTVVSIVLIEIDGEAEGVIGRQLAQFSVVVQ